MLLYILSTPLGVAAIAANISNSVAFKVLANLILVIPGSCLFLSVTGEEPVFNNAVSSVIILN